MKGPKRLINEDPGFARLFSALESDGPKSAQVDKALALATRTAAASGSGWASSRWLGTSAGPIALAVVGVSALLGAFVVLASDPSPGGVAAPRSGVAAPQERVAPLATATFAPAPPVPVAPEAPVVSVRVDDLPPAPVVAPPASRAPSREAEGAAAAARETPAATPTFAEELALASEARSALEAGDVASCLRAVERYDQRFRSGTFAQEIDVIRIEALAKSGQRARAHALAERFLAVNARSPYADRVRSVLEHTKESP